MLSTMTAVMRLKRERTRSVHTASRLCLGSLSLFAEVMAAVCLGKTRGLPKKYRSVPLVAGPVGQAAQGQGQTALHRRDVRSPCGPLRGADGLRLAVTSVWIQTAMIWKASGKNPSRMLRRMRDCLGVAQELLTDVKISMSGCTFRTMKS